MFNASSSQAAADKAAKVVRKAVVDIGSNSVRLVIYDVAGRSIQPRFNEKVLAGLGRGMSSTGALNPEGVDAALKALSRFKSLMKAQAVDEEIAFATAAARDATDGPEFIARVRHDIGLSIKVLSGQDEARLAATGVIAMQPQTDGVCGDLGGSSLELSTIVDGYFTGGTTYKLGPLALLSTDWLQKMSASDIKPADFAGVAKDLSKTVEETLASAGELRGSQTDFYMVGGAWRAITRIHMELTNYPLRVLQNYAINAEELIELTNNLITPDKKLLALMNEISTRRAKTLPAAAAVLNGILKVGQFKRAITASYGVREGLIYEGLTSEHKAADPLLAGIKAMIAYNRDATHFGAALAPWTQAAARATLPERLSEAACLAADIGARMHPDHRADMAFEWLVTSPHAGLTHEERAGVALAVACRYQRGYRHIIASKLLDSDMAAQARALGALMRLGAHFSGRSADLLKYARLDVRGGAVYFDVDKEHKELMSEMVRKRLTQAATILGMEAKLSFSGEAVEV